MKPEYTRYYNDAKALNPWADDDEILRQYNDRYGTHVPASAPSFERYAQDAQRLNPWATEEQIREQYDKNYTMGLGEEALRSLKRGFGGIAEAVGTVMGAYDVAPGFAAQAEQFGSGLVEENYRSPTIEPKFWEDWGQLVSPQYWASMGPEILTSTLPSLGPGLAANLALRGAPAAMRGLGTAAGVGVGGAAGGYMEGAQEYKQALEEGLSPDEARQRMELMAAGVTGLNFIPGAAMFSRLPGMNKMLATGAGEALTEYAEGPLSDVIAGREIDPLAELPVVPPAFAAGMLFGGLQGNVDMESGIDPTLEATNLGGAPDVSHGTFEGAPDIAPGYTIKQAQSGDFFLDETPGYYEAPQHIQQREQFKEWFDNTLTPEQRAQYAAAQPVADVADVAVAEPAQTAQPRPAEDITDTADTAGTVEEYMRPYNDALNQAQQERDSLNERHLAEGQGLTDQEYNSDERVQQRYQETQAADQKVAEAQAAYNTAYTQRQEQQQAAQAAQRAEEVVQAPGQLTMADIASERPLRSRQAQQSANHLRRLLGNYGGDITRMPQPLQQAATQALEGIQQAEDLHFTRDVAALPREQYAVQGAMQPEMGLAPAGRMPIRALQNELAPLTKTDSDSLNTILSNLVATGMPRSAITDLEFFSLPVMDSRGRRNPYAQMRPKERAVGVREDILKSLETYNSQEAWMAVTSHIAHELGHSYDLDVNARSAAVDSPYFALPDEALSFDEQGRMEINPDSVGAVLMEAIEAWVNDTQGIGDFLHYPLAKIKTARDPAVKEFIQYETMAQLTALYYTHPGLLEETMPTAYMVISEVHNVAAGATTTSQRNREVRGVLRSRERTDGGRQGIGSAAAGDGSAYGRGDGEAGAGAGAVRPERRGNYKVQHRQYLSGDRQGQYVGAPPSFNTPKKVKKLRDSLHKLALEGEQARFWYKDSAESVLEITGGNLQEAEKLIQLIAIFSPANQVGGNTTAAIKAYHQWKNGQPVTAGRFGAHTKNANDLLYGGKNWDGRKTNSFYINLMQEIDPTMAGRMYVGPEGPIMLEPGEKPGPDMEHAQTPVTVDMWIARAFDYGKDSVGMAQYRFAEKEIVALAEDLGWAPHEAQAAVWVSMKARWEQVKGGSPDSAAEHHAAYKKAMAIDHPADSEIHKSAVHFGTYIDRATDYVTWEAVPSVDLGFGLEKMDFNQRRQFTDAARGLITNGDKDQLAQSIGVPLFLGRQGVGGYESAINPNQISGIVNRKVEQLTSTGKKELVFDHKMADVYAQAIQYIYMQDGVPWFRPDPAAGGAKASVGASFKFQDDLTPEMEERVFQALRNAVGEDVGFTRVNDNEIAVINFRGPQKDKKGNEVYKPYLMPDVQFRKALDNFLAANQDELGVTAATEFKAEGTYHEHDWNQDPEGTAIETAISEAGRSDLLPWLRDRREAFRQLVADTQAQAEVGPAFGAYGWLGEPPMTLRDGDPLLRDTSMIKTPQREKMREGWVRKILAGGKPVPEGRRPVVHVMGGGGASGKGTILEFLQSTGEIPQVPVIDADAIKGMIPEYQQIIDAGDSRAAEMTHEESSDVSKRAMRQAMDSRYEFVLDRTLGNPDKGIRELQALKDAGYEVRLYGVSIPTDVAIERAAGRAGKTGRWVPLDMLANAHIGFSQGFERYAQLADKAVLFDNMDGPQVVASKSEAGELAVSMLESYNGFVAKGASNAQAEIERVSGGQEAQRLREGIQIRPRSVQGGAGQTSEAGGGRETPASRSVPREGLGPAFGRDAFTPTPEGSPIGGFAGSVNLDKLSSADDVKALIREIAGSHSDIINSARRGTRDWGTTERVAEAMGMTAKQLAKRKIGQAYNAEELEAARMVLEASAQDLRDKGVAAATSGSFESQVALKEAYLRHVMIQSQYSGLATEAGRALNILRKKSQTVDNLADLIDDFDKAGLNFQDFAAMISEAETTGQLTKLTRDTFQSTLSDKLLEIWINALLSGPQTHATNMLSNTIVGEFTALEHWVAAGLGMLHGGDKVSFREAVAYTVGGIQGAREGLRNGRIAFATEEAQFGDTKVEARRYQAIGGRKGKWIRTPGRALMAEDEFFKGMGYRRQINALAMRQALKEKLSGRALTDRYHELVQNPSKEMIAQAQHQAAYMTFTNPLGEFGKAVQKMAQAHPLMRVVIPFIRTPTNIVKFALARTPMALLFREVRHQLSGAQGNAVRDVARARILMGSSIGMLVMSYVAQGLITGGGPDDPKRRNTLYASGWQPYSIKINGEWVSYGRMEPLGMLFGISADMAEIQEYMSADEEANVAALITGSISKNLTSKTWLRGLSDALNAVHDPDRYGASYIRNLVGTVVPTGVAQVARNQDPMMRDARSIVDKIKSRIPGQGGAVAPKVDIWGEPITLNGGVGPDLLSPLYTSKVKRDPATQTLMDAGYYPGSPSRNIGGVELSPQQYLQYAQVSGRMAHQLITQLAYSNGFNSLGREQRKDIIADIFRDIRRYARAQIVQQNPMLARAIMLQ